MTSLRPPRGPYQSFGKRCLDLAIALPLLVLTVPLMLLITAVIYLKLGSPIFFRQGRVGKGERIFRLTKFRTMTDARDAAGRLLPDGQRLTPLGLFLRRCSLDELPQLLDVVRGTMSLVGPRPLLVRYLPRYDQSQRCRHLVLPGVTGLAQIGGRNRLGWPDRFRLDLDYVERQSLGLDLWILWRTLAGLADTSGTLPGGSDEVEEFWGTAGRPREAATSRQTMEQQR
jgi:lipopolysaccharide/colanic/teichoic acid biosynthesis glycosyltransferase